MIIKKQMPEQGDLVLIKISKIMPHGAYCELTEYGIDAYLPISEIASGWIKNIHEFIKEGQKDVAKVIAVDAAKRAVDVSLKKATAKERSDKLSEYNLEKRAEKLFNQAIVAAHAEADKEGIIDEIAAKAQTYNEVIAAAASDPDSLSFLKEAEFRNAIIEIAVKNTKPKRYTVNYIAEIKASSAKTGIETIKKALSEIAKTGVTVLYLGAPHYKLSSEDASYPEAEERIKGAESVLEKYSKHLAFTLKAEKAKQA